MILFFVIKLWRYQYLWLHTADGVITGEYWITKELEQAVVTYTRHHLGTVPAATETNHQDPQTGQPVLAETRFVHHSNKTAQHYRYIYLPRLPTTM